jgi:hypothetical protein
MISSFFIATVFVANGTSIAALLVAAGIALIVMISGTAIIRSF